MLKLTLQVFLDAQWQDMALLSFDKKSYEFIELNYLPEYAFDHLELTDHYACSIHYPVHFFQDSSDYAYFLDDIMPAGASRTYWVNHLNLKGLNIHRQNYELLKCGAIAPIGNLRIKEAYERILPNLPKNQHYYSLDDVINRDVNFLTDCQEQGMIVSGATGAGGEAPKILLRYHQQQGVWIDNQQLGDCYDDYYLVKYPRGNKTAIDCDILRAEYHYYQELENMGFRTIETTKMRLEEGQHYPSLWLPRFDVFYDEQGNFQRYAVESVYSMMKKSAGTSLKHENCIHYIIDLINKNNLAFDVQGFVIEWLRRDLLNIAFGNSDNHGRNTAFLRYKNEIKLAPIYDFAPMKADPDGIVRTIKWQTPLELGGEFDFEQICQSLDTYIEPTQLHQALQETAEQLIDLKTRLKKRGVPKDILEHPSIHFASLATNLKKWKVLT